MLLVCRDYLRRLPDQRDVLLVVEVALSSLRDDRGRKLAAYTRTSVERFADLDGGSSATVDYLQRGETIAPRAFPDDAIAIDEFLAQVARMRITDERGESGNS